MTAKDHHEPTRQLQCPIDGKLFLKDLSVLQLIVFQIRKIFLITALTNKSSYSIPWLTRTETIFRLWSILTAFIC